jgi:hypothetical protein
MLAWRAAECAIFTLCQYDSAQCQRIFLLQGWRVAAGGWRVAAGGWRLAAGGWRLAAGIGISD